MANVYLNNFSQLVFVSGHKAAVYCGSDHHFGCTQLNSEHGLGIILNLNGTLMLWERLPHQVTQRKRKKSGSQRTIFFHLEKRPWTAGRRDNKESPVGLGRRGETHIAFDTISLYLAFALVIFTKAGKSFLFK